MIFCRKMYFLKQDMQIVKGSSAMCKCRNIKHLDIKKNFTKNNKSIKMSYWKGYGKSIFIAMRVKIIITGLKQNMIVSSTTYKAYTLRPN